MIFSYLEDRGDGESRHLPLVPFVIHGPTASVELLGLVDSGAEHNVLSMEYADRAGLSVADGIPVRMIGVGDHEMPGYLVSMQLEVGRHRWEAPAICSANVENTAILGQIGFFAFFTVTFRRTRLQMEIRRARSTAGVPYVR